MPDIHRYFDHAAATPVSEEVLVAMQRYMLQDFGNPNSLHEFGYEAKKAMDSAREQIATAIGAEAKDIVFAGSGTEANNMAVLGAARRMRRLGKGSHVIVSAIEHPSVREACRALEREDFSINYASVDGAGRVDPEEIRQMITSDTTLICVMHANNVVGTLQPIAEIGRLARENGVLFHCDAIQSFGKAPIDVKKLGVHLMSLNAHKIGGPKGVAALYLGKGVRIDPLIHGGGQERGLRPATQNVAGIVGFAKAAELMLCAEQAEWERMSKLRQRLLQGLTNRIPGCKLNGHITECLPTHVNISIDRVEGQALMLELDRRGFATSSGSACSSMDYEPSYVLLAMGKSREVALESLRITMGRSTTGEDVDALIEALASVAETWRTAVNLPRE